MHATLRQLRLFAALAEHGSVTAAAKACHVTQPTVSMQLKDLTDAVQGSRHHLLRIARETALFVVGFTVVFVLLGITATTIGSAVFRDKELLLRISGALVVAMALFLAGSLVLKRPGWYREARFHPKLERYGPFAAPVAGAAFGCGWQPCLGPILASVSAVASAMANGTLSMRASV